MIVAALINGSIISEEMAIYALWYAQKLGYPLHILHIKSKDDIKDVKRSVENIKALSKGVIDIKFNILQNLSKLKTYIEKRGTDLLFCSTRCKHNIYDKSFVKSVIKQKIKADLAVVKIVKIGSARSVDKIILPIRGAKLSVKKFSLFSSFVSIFGAKSEIYSIDKVSMTDATKINVAKQKERLKDVVFHLRHYIRLLKLQNLSFSLKHSFARVESHVVQSHIAKNGHNLAIIGAHHDKSFFKSHPIDVLFEEPMINVIYFIPEGRL